MLLLRHDGAAVLGSRLRSEKLEIFVGLQNSFSPQHLEVQQRLAWFVSTGLSVVTATIKSWFEIVSWENVAQQYFAVKNGWPTAHCC